jgi:hypothetical protein
VVIGRQWSVVFPEKIKPTASYHPPDLPSSHKHKPTAQTHHLCCGASGSAVGTWQLFNFLFKMFHYVFQSYAFHLHYRPQASPLGIGIYSQLYPFQALFVCLSLPVGRR